MNQQTDPEVKKMRGHVKHLLEGVVRLRYRYALLEPMRHGVPLGLSEPPAWQTTGLAFVREALVLTCASDIANIAFDKHEKSPSVEKIMAKLERPGIRDVLRDQRGNWFLPPDPTDKEADGWAPGKAWREKRTAKRVHEFDMTLNAIQSDWRKLQSDQTLCDLDLIRKKAAAHTDLLVMDGQYQAFDMNSLGLRFSRVGAVVGKLQAVVAGLDAIVRDAIFDWDALEGRLAAIRSGFWRPCET